MPTLVTVPPPTGAKSHARGPEPLLMVLVGGVVVCAEAVELPRNNTTAIDASSRTAAERKIRTRASRMGASARSIQEPSMACRMPDAGLDVVCAEFVAAHAEWLARARTTSKGTNVAAQLGDYRNSKSGVNLIEHGGLSPLRAPSRACRRRTRLYACAKCLFQRRRNPRTCTAD